MRMVNEFNAPGVMAPPHFLPQFDDAKCTYCGKCAKSCPMGALAIDVRQRTRRHLAARCIGCGLCVVACGDRPGHRHGARPRLQAALQELVRLPVPRHHRHAQERLEGLAAPPVTRARSRQACRRFAAAIRDVVALCPANRGTTKGSRHGCTHSRSPGSRSSPSIAPPARTGCCAQICPTDLLRLDADHVTIHADSPLGCIACGHMMVCPEQSVNVMGRGLSPADLMPLPPPNGRATAEAFAALRQARRSVSPLHRPGRGRAHFERIVALAASGPMWGPPLGYGLRRGRG